MSALDKAQFDFAHELLCETIDTTIQNIKEAKTEEQKIKYIIVVLEALNGAKKFEGELFSSFFTTLTELFEITKKLSNRISELEERIEK